LFDGTNGVVARESDLLRSFDLKGRHENAEACAQHCFFIQLIRETKPWLEVTAIRFPNVAVVFVGKSVAAEHVEVRGRHDKVRGVCIERSGISGAHLRLNRARRAEVEAAQNAG
jgi:hypothetical protein